MICTLNGQTHDMTQRSFQSFASQKVVVFNAVLGLVNGEGSVRTDFPRTFELLSDTNGRGAIKGYDGDGNLFFPGTSGTLQVFSRFSDAERIFSEDMDRYNKDPRWSLSSAVL